MDQTVKKRASKNIGARVTPKDGFAASEREIQQTAENVVGGDVIDRAAGSTKSNDKAIGKSDEASSSNGIPNQSQDVQPGNRHRLFRPEPHPVQFVFPGDLSKAWIAVGKVARRAALLLGATLHPDTARPPHWKNAGDIVKDAADLTFDVGLARDVLEPVKQKLIQAHQGIQYDTPLAYDGIRTCAHEIALHFAEIVVRNIQVAWVKLEVDAKLTNRKLDHKTLLSAIRNQMTSIAPLDGRILGMAMDAEVVAAGNADPAPELLTNAKVKKLYGIPGSRVSEAVKSGKLETMIDPASGKMRIVKPSAEKWALERRSSPKETPKAEPKSVSDSKPCLTLAPKHHGSLKVAVVANAGSDPTLGKNYQCKDCRKQFSTAALEPRCECGSQNVKPLPSDSLE